MPRFQSALFRESRNPLRIESVPLNCLFQLFPGRKKSNPCRILQVNVRFLQGVHLNAVHARLLRGNGILVRSFKEKPSFQDFARKLISCKIFTRKALLARILHVMNFKQEMNLKKYKRNAFSCKILKDSCEILARNAFFSNQMTEKALYPFCRGG